MNPGSQNQNVFISFVENSQKKITLEKSRPLPKANTILSRFSCNKCRFSSRDEAQFNKHALQHVEMTFSCSYCNHVSYTKGESQRHLVKHTGSFPFKCQYCPYGAVRNDYIVKHTQRVHKVFEAKASYRADKSRLDLEQELHSTKTGTYASSLSTGTCLPAAGVISSTSVNTSAIGKRSSASGSSKVQVELLSPLNEPIQHDKPLTIAYSPEMNIPPGCVVELVEVKTVNGTKELELKLVPQQAAETESPARNLAIQTPRVGFQNNHVDKPTFRCSVLPQENTTIHPEPCAVNHEKRDSCMVKTVVDVSRDQNSGFRKHSNEPHAVLNEEPKVDEHRLCAKSSKQGSTSLFQNRGQKSQGSGKPESSLQPQLLKSTERAENDSTRHNVVRTEPSRVCSIGELPRHIAPKTHAISQIPSQPTSNFFPMRDSPSKGKFCPPDAIPLVKRVPASFREVKGLNDAGTITDLPVISSVFSMSQGPGDPPNGIRWEQALNGHVGTPPQNGGISTAPEQRKSVNTVPSRHVSASVDTNERPKEIKIPIFTSKRAKITDTESVEMVPPSPAKEASASSSGQTTIPPLNEISPCDLDKNRAVASDRRKIQKSMEDPMPVFIPKGAVLKILEANKPSLTLKISAPASEMSGSWVPRPVLSSSTNERNISDADLPCQSKVPKISLKRRKSGAENKGFDEDLEQQDLQIRDADAWILTKEKTRKRGKQTTKAKARLTEKSPEDAGRLWLIPLKEDQLVKCPGPDQPVVVLNHPKPQALWDKNLIQTTQRDSKGFPSCVAPTGEQSFLRQSRTTRQSPDQTRRTLKMKLKKIQKNKYQIVGFVFGDSQADSKVLVR
ncbi:hypothetical protein GJAV_G00167930 [Gymnothorax javanicus]|nr:hypothetical protein GJAV_G00167930 [Gymnothorax javanicus]